MLLSLKMSNLTDKSLFSMPRRSAATARGYKEFCGKINPFTLAERRKKYRDTHKQKLATKILEEEKMRAAKKWIATTGRSFIELRSF